MYRTLAIFLVVSGLIGPALWAQSPPVHTLLTPSAGGVQLAGAPIGGGPGLKVAFAGIAENLSDSGYQVTIIPKSTRDVALGFVKVGQTEGKGLLGVKWAQKLEGEAKYVLVDGEWMYIGGQVYAWEKPPVIGGWKIAEPDPATVAKLQEVLAVRLKHSEVYPAKKN